METCIAIQPTSGQKLPKSQELSEPLQTHQNNRTDRSVNWLLGPLRPWWFQWLHENNVKRGLAVKIELLAKKGVFLSFDSIILDIKMCLLPANLQFLLSKSNKSDLTIKLKESKVEKYFSCYFWTTSRPQRKAVLWHSISNSSGVGCDHNDNGWSSVYCCIAVSKSLV